MPGAGISAVILSNRLNRVPFDGDQLLAFDPLQKTG